MASQRATPQQRPKIADLKSTAEAVEYLGRRVSATFLIRARLGGYGPPYVRLGTGRCSRIFYAASDLDDWIDSCRRNPAERSS